MQLTEQHVISCDEPRYSVIDEVAFKSKNLYNAALYEIRQAFIHQGKYLSYNQMDKLMKHHEAYHALPAKVSQQVLKLLDKNWKSFFEALKAYKEDPSKFTGLPKLPKYKHKTEGRNLLVYTLQALSGGQTLNRDRGNAALRRGIIQPAGLDITVQTKQNPTTIDQVRIIPRHGHYVVEIIYTRKTKAEPVDPSFCVAIDIGVNNLAAITSNRVAFVPRLVNGRPLKARNQWYNKRIKELTKKQPKAERDRVTRQMEHITNKRNRQVNHFLHTQSRRIIDFLVHEGVGTIIIGKNPLWKQECNMGRTNNQNFVQIPHARFIDILTYKAKLVGIRVEVREESYTSKASFLDLDPIPDYKPGDETKHRFSGRRVKRGLYRASGKREINSDVNGSYNILRKSRPNAFKAKGAEDGKQVLASVVVHPVRLVVPLTKPKASNSASKRSTERQISL